MSMINQVKTVLLLGALTGLMLAVGWFLAGEGGLLIALVIALAINFGMYWFSDKIVLRMYNAKQADPQQYRALHQMVEEVARNASIPKPAVYIIPSQTPNAFATGRNPKNAVVACTAGIMQLLSHEELKGVLAHEVSHVKNRDMLVTTIAAALAGVISYVATMAQWGALFGGRDEDGPNMFSVLALAIVTPIIATIIQLAISRSREFLADSSGAKILRNGEPLARALEKIEAGAKHIPMRQGSPATSSLFIVNPFRGGGITSLLSTHPPTAERARRLREMKF